MINSGTRVEGAHLMEDMSKDELIFTLQAERAGWDALIKQLEPAQLDQPGVEQDWSVKDLLGHLSHYEQALVERLQAAQRGEARPPHPYDGLETDARNAKVFADNHNRPAAEVLAEAQTIFEQLIAALEALDEATFNDPTAAGRIISADYQNKPMWKAIRNESQDHYLDHVEALQNWIERTTS